MGESYPGSRPFIREGLKNNGVPMEAIEVMISSLSNSSLKQYNNGLKLWWQFCRVSNLNPYHNSIKNVLDFLTRQYKRGASYGTLNTIRSAISLLIGPSIGSDFRIKRFFKGIFRINPPTPKFRLTWDPNIVLTYLSQFSDNDDMSLELLSYKLVTLLALITAHRVQTFSLIEIQNINTSEERVEIKIPARIKNSGPNKYQPVLILPFFNEKPEICAASVLISYMNRTKDIRRTNSLFISFRRPYKAATAQTLSRWIKGTLEKSGLDTSIFTAHTTRHAATSAAFRKGLNLDVIRNTAGWTENSNIFARFYNRPLATKDSFASTILSK